MNFKTLQKKLLASVAAGLLLSGAGSFDDLSASRRSIVPTDEPKAKDKRLQAVQGTPSKSSPRRASIRSSVYSYNKSDTSELSAQEIRENLEGSQYAFSSLGEFVGTVNAALDEDDAWSFDTKKNIPLADPEQRSSRTKPYRVAICPSFTLKTDEEETLLTQAFNSTVLPYVKFVIGKQADAFDAVLAQFKTQSTNSKAKFAEDLKDNDKNPFNLLSVAGYKLFKDPNDLGAAPYEHARLYYPFHEVMDVPLAKSLAAVIAQAIEESKPKEPKASKKKAATTPKPKAKVRGKSAIDAQKEQEERLRLAAEQKRQEEEEAAEQERIRQEKAEQERIRQEEEAEQERIRQEKAEQERIRQEEEEAEQERIRQEKAEQERIRQEKAEQKRLEAAEKKRMEEEAKQERIHKAAEKKRLEEEAAEQERVRQEKEAEQERVRQEKEAEQERIRLASEKLLEARAEEERVLNAAMDELLKDKYKTLQSFIGKIFPAFHADLRTHLLTGQSRFAVIADTIDEKNSSIADVRQGNFMTSSVMHPQAFLDAATEALQFFKANPEETRTTKGKFKFAVEANKLVVIHTSGQKASASDVYVGFENNYLKHAKSVIQEEREEIAKLEATPNYQSFMAIVKLAQGSTPASALLKASLLQEGKTPFEFMRDAVKAEALSK